MIDMKTKVKSKAILLPSFFIVLGIGILQFVEADLPNQHRLGAIPCVREIFGEDFLRPTFQKDEDELSDGEYLGAACDDLGPDYFLKSIKNEIEGTYDYDGKIIKKCLEEKDRLTLFDKYSAMGALYKVDQTESGSNAKKPEDKVEESELDEETSKLLSSPIFYFFLGICKSKNEEVEFNKVTDKEDKTKVLTCLARCTSKFLVRLEKILLFGKAEALSLLQHTIKEIKNTRLNFSNDDTEGIAQQLKVEKAEEGKINGLYDDLMKKAKIGDEDSANSFFGAYQNKADKTESTINMIKEMAKKYLYQDSDVYHYIHHYVKNYDKDDLIARFDPNLYVTFLMYKDCSRVGCGMDLDSIPLYNLIVEGAKDPDKHSLIQLMKVFIEDRNWYTPVKRIFFKALVEPSKNASQAESNEEK